MYKRQGVVEFTAAVNVAVPGVFPVLLAKVPLGADHIAEVAPPPKDPPKAADVAPWHMAVIAAPASAVGSGLTVTVATELFADEQIPLVTTAL